VPIYEYECSNEACGIKIEENTPMNAKRRKRCPKCRHKVERIYSPAGIQFKGDGWYVTDYKNRSPAPKATPRKAPSNERKTSVKFTD
jgi:putative FmdB family regulatory protein